MKIVKFGPIDIRLTNAEWESACKRFDLSRFREEWICPSKSGTKDEFPIMINNIPCPLCEKYGCPGCPMNIPNNKRIRIFWGNWWNNRKASIRMKRPDTSFFSICLQPEIALLGPMAPGCFFLMALVVPDPDLFVESIHKKQIIFGL